MSEVLLQAEGLRKVYRVGSTDLEVLGGVDLAVRRGEVVAVLGPSGAGKSTLLHLMGCLDRPTAGTVLLRGRDVNRLGGLTRARLRNREIGFVFQFYHLIPELTALENVVLPAQVGSGVLAWLGRRGEARARARKLLTEIGMAERLRHRPSQLSGGERQRVALARALMNQPAAVLCDEPTGNLDQARSREVQELLWGVRDREGAALVVVTHDASVAARADRVIRLLDGKVVSDGPPQAETASPLDVARRAE